jgi:uncharacterized membrane protein YphA (DoxX/SURF4 family)
MTLTAVFSSGRSMTEISMNKFKATALWLFQVLLVMPFLVAGVPKLLGSPGWIARFRTYGYPEGFYWFVGAVEIVGALVFLIPRVSLYGALALIVVMAGAIVSHLQHSEIQRSFVALTLGVLVAIAGYARRRAWNQEKSVEKQS